MTPSRHGRTHNVGYPKDNMSFTYADCKAILEKDFPNSGGENLKNIDSYYVATNTWVALTATYDQLMADWLRYTIWDVGLVNSIRLTTTASDALIDGLAEWEGQSLRTLVRSCSLKGDIADIICDFSGDLADLLLVLRYPKRLTLPYAPKALEDTIYKFNGVNFRCAKAWPRLDDSILTGEFEQYRTVPVIWQWVRDVIAYLCQYYESPALGDFTGGAVADDCRNCIMEKVEAYSRYDACLYSPLYPISKDYRNPLDIPSKVAAVPKSYKVFRIIAMETAYRQFHLSGIRRALETAVRRLDDSIFERIDIRSQERNRVMAMVGSIDGHLATIDLSSASDSISRVFASKVIPVNLFTDLEKWNTSHYVIGKKKFKKNIFLLSGNSATFIVETIIFFSIAVVGTLLSTDGSYELPSVYGDDIICDVRAYDTICDVLNACGFTVNSEKSYGSGTLFRESCGIECFKGDDISSRYFPRRVIDFKNAKAESVKVLCELQHTFFDLPRVRLVLNTIIKRVFPKMTSSEPYTDADDLWSYNPDAEIVPAPGSNGEHTRELHYCYRTVTTEATGSDAYEMYLYVSYLREGPQYDDELSRLLRVSTSRRRRADGVHPAKMQWRRMKR